MNNFNQDQNEDDFLTLQLGPPSSSKPSVGTSSTPDPETFRWGFEILPNVRVSQNPMLPRQHPGGASEPVTPDQAPPPVPPAGPVHPSRVGSTDHVPAPPSNSETFRWGFELLPNVRVSQNPLLLPHQHPGGAAEPVTPDQAPPPAGPVQRSRVGSRKPEHVPAPYPWATSKRATVHSMGHLLANKITQIGGDVECKTCTQKYWMEYDLEEKFNEVCNYIVNNWGNFHDRAPVAWTNPSLPSCRHCKQEGSVKPVMGGKKKSINWLFLFLGQMLGCCTLGHLRYFCKHTSNHRTGAKDRLLYLAYLELRNQLHPTDPSLENQA